jgi:hypothetical protein
MMEKKSLKEAIGIRPQDEFVRQGLSGDKSTNLQIDKSSKIKPVKVSFYWDPETEQDVEQLRLRFFEKYRRKLTRSEVVEALVRNALKNEKIIDELV